MRRTAFLLLALLSSNLLAQLPQTQPAPLQPVPFGVGVGVGAWPRYPFGTYPYGYLGYFPSQYNGFYTNGFSAYGPPVPTYGIVPGTFGASDYRLNNIR